MAVALQVVLVSGQTLEADGAAGVDLAGRDADLRAEAVSIAVRKARRGVVEDTRGVDAGHEYFGGFRVIGDDRLGVLGAVLIDVGDSLVDVFDDLDRQLEIAVLGSPVLGCRLADVDDLAGRFVATEFDARVHVALDETGEEVGCDCLAHEQRLDRVADGGVLHLRVEGDVFGHLEVGIVVDVDVTDTLRVAQHRDLRVVLDVGDELRGAPGHHEIDLPVQLEQAIDFLVCLDQLRPTVGKFRCRLFDDSVKGLV